MIFLFIINGFKVRFTKGRVVELFISYTLTRKSVSLQAISLSPGNFDEPGVYHFERPIVVNAPRDEHYDVFNSVPDLCLTP